MLPILLATGNPDKQRMLEWLLEGLPVRPVKPADLAVHVHPDESGETHESIARSKAAAWSQAAGIPAVASDGGLLLPALGANWESRYTRRFAGPAADDAERQRRLLELLAPYSGAARSAAFVEGLAIADAGQTVASWEVQGPTGRIVNTLPEAGRPTARIVSTLPEAGSPTAGIVNTLAEAGRPTDRIVSNLAEAGSPTSDSGFWVFPLWRFAEYGRTYDRLTQAERAALGDHWAALRELVQKFLPGWAAQRHPAP